MALIAGCSGGGCAGGCACGGMTPLVNGYDKPARIENVGAVRLTDTGLAFLQDNLQALAEAALGGDGSGMLSFPVDTSTGEFGVAGFNLVAYTVCPSGPDDSLTPPLCTAEIDLAGAQLAFDIVEPHSLTITGPLPVRIQNLPIDLTWLIIFQDSTTVVLNSDGDTPVACPGAVQSFADLTLNVDISIEIDADPLHVREGYTRVRFADLSIDSTDLSAALHFCGGSLSTDILNALKGVMVTLLGDMIIGQLTGSFEDALCVQANYDSEWICPMGTNDVDGVCRYGVDSSAECAGAPLGIEGRIDLASILPLGSRGVFDMLLAAGGHSLRTDGSGMHWGDLNPVAGGATVGLYGGTRPAPAVSCAPPAAVEQPPTFPIPDELLANTVSGWPAGTPGPHVGFAVAEGFLSYSLAQMHNAGALCLGIPGDMLAGVSTGMLAVGLGATSLSELGLMGQTQPVAITIRPAEPPVLTLGNGTNLISDPLLRVVWSQLSLDFYVWSLDRYIRVLTATVDVDVPANLEVTPEGLQPVIDEIGLSNTVISNTTLLREDPETIGSTLEDLVGGLIGGLIGDSLPPVDLNAQLADLGLEVIIPPTEPGQGSPGLRLLTKDGERFLGVFASLGLASSTAARAVDTQVELLDFEPAEGAPVATLALGSSAADGSRPVEWQYRVDNLPWHPFHSSRRLELRDRWLRLQGRHQVSVRSRIAGEPATLDPTPAVVEVLVDDYPPVVGLSQDEHDGSVRLRVADAISPPEQIAVRYRLSYGDRAEWEPWSEWLQASAEGLELGDLAPATFISVEAQDESENVGTVTQPLIRGQGSEVGGSACALVRPLNGRGGAWLAGILLGFLLALRRARRR